MTDPTTAYIAAGGVLLGAAITSIPTIIVPILSAWRTRLRQERAARRAKVLQVLRDLQDLQGMKRPGGPQYGGYIGTDDVRNLAMFTLEKSVTELEAILTSKDLAIAWIVLDAARHHFEVGSHREVDRALVAVGKWQRGEAAADRVAHDYSSGVGRPVPSQELMMAVARGIAERADD